MKSEFIPVAIDQAYQRRQQDTEGDFYRKIAGQSPRNNFRSTTQGFYVASANGELLFFNNNRDPEKILRLMTQSLTQFKKAPPATPVAQLHADKVDKRYNATPPDGGLVVRVRAKILGGYQPTTNRTRQIFQTALSRDNLWITSEEHSSLVRGEFPESLKTRISRFHFVDNTRGEPPMWKTTEIRTMEMSLSDGVVHGFCEISTENGDRGFDAELRGKIEAANGRLVRMDLVCLGEFWGEGRYTGGAPEGKFPLAISFTLADGTDLADRIPPQGSRGWVAGYLK